MKLSAPIYILKQQDKSLSRKEKIPLHQALDRIANREGFSTRSLLAAGCNSDERSTALLSRLSPGDLVLLGGRPGQGKTLLGRLHSRPAGISASKDARYYRLSSIVGAEARQPKHNGSGGGVETLRAGALACAA